MVLKSCCSRLLKATSSVEAVRKVSGKSSKLLSIHDIKLVISPNEKLIDDFMNGYGKQRLNFKRNDIDTWKECFEGRYRLVFTCLKGSDRIIQTSHFLNYEAVAPHVDTTHQYQGFFWIDPEFRGQDSMKLVDYVTKNMLVNFSENGLAQCLPPSMNLWNKIYGHQRVGHVMNVSYYKPNEMRVPDELKFDGIFVRNAAEVPDVDIVKYDQGIFPYERSAYILRHLRDPAGFGKVAYDENGRVVGIGTVVIYPSGECVLTPLYADDKRVAQAIFKCILQEMPLGDPKLLRFQIRSLDKMKDGFGWIQPFVSCPLRKEIMGYLVFSSHSPKIDYRKVFVNVPYTTSAI